MFACDGKFPWVANAGGEDPTVLGLPLYREIFMG